MRCLGIDYGEKRIGLAYGDELGLALPLPALVQPDKAQRLDALRRLARERRVTDLVVGYPYNMDGSVGFKAREVDAFIAELTTELPLPVHRVDERLSSYAAEGTLTRPKKRTVRAQQQHRASGVIDSQAAALILQDFLDSHLPMLPPEAP